jgi:hypothetical protein
MDDVLDVLLHGADEDLGFSLGQALDLLRGRASIVVLGDAGPLPRPNRAHRLTSSSVEDCINRLEALLIGVNRSWIRRDCGLVAMNELRTGLEMHRLSWEEANQLIDQISTRVRLARSSARGSVTLRQPRDILSQALDVVGDLRVAVARLFDDSHDQSVLT